MALSSLHFLPEWENKAIQGGDGCALGTVEWVTDYDNSWLLGLLGGGGGGGGSGGIDTKALDICTELLFGVALESFTAAQGGLPGTAANGSFTGLMAGSELTVVTDVSMDIH